MIIGIYQHIFTIFYMVIGQSPSKSHAIRNQPFSINEWEIGSHNFSQLNMKKQIKVSITEVCREARILCSLLPVWLMRCVSGSHLTSCVPTL